ncbi:uncharacterized protein CcaverHIS019_0200400 [Cutaneotrichosporon cavernicola]|uniref:Uncharacterized protein n=1 Tax=Cutaneotrichosporon cavernicola TaxID=279322 RepID=A0AA48IEU0_9TREE|nr:uncharacterized protein CcaverHIS019_0200400 [Cutaneotrichosporon cavernicola]BEI88678.1 hypothetical protein CcaverHIS019_0200400 [Cutaneotrichosporon cavernicola]
MDDPHQTLEDCMQAESFMHKHGMLPEPGTDAYGSGVYACKSCLSTKSRCLVPALAHIGHKRFRTHACLRCDGCGCSLEGLVMSETSTGGLYLEQPEDMGTTMKQVGGHVSVRTTTTTTSASGHTSTSASAHTHDGEKLGGSLRRPRKLVRSCGATPGIRSKSPSQTSRAGSPPIQLPTPRNSSPSHTGSSEGAVSALVNSSPPSTSTALQFNGDVVLATALAPALSVGDGLVTTFMSKHETKHVTNTDLSPPPAPPTALASFATSIHIAKRRRVSSLALGPNLSTVSRGYNSEEYTEAVNTARAEMRSAEAVLEASVAHLANAQYISRVAIEASDRNEAEVERIEAERQDAIARTAACDVALVTLRADGAIKKLAREEAAAVVITSQENVTVVEAQVEERREAYRRVVHGFSFIVE